MDAKTLIGKLKDLDPETEIRIAVLPNYPFAVESSATSLVDMGEVAYIGEGSQIGYLSLEASQALGWIDKDQDDTIPINRL